MPSVNINSNCRSKRAEAKLVIAIVHFQSASHRYARIRCITHVRCSLHVVTANRTNKLVILFNNRFNSPVTAINNIHLLHLTVNVRMPVRCNPHRSIVHRRVTDLRSLAGTWQVQRQARSCHPVLTTLQLT